MPIHQLPIEERVRRYTELGWTTREIARRVRKSQSTVVRIRQKINTGPNPILSPGDESPPRSRRRWLVPRLNIGIVVGVLALAVAGLAGFLIGNSPGTAKDPQVTACVKVSAAGAVTGLTAPGGGGTCPPKWETVILLSG